MPSDNATDLRLGKMNRPEYVSAPEGLLTAISWGVHDVTNMNQGKKTALVYRGEPRIAKTLDFVFTAPEGEEELSKWSDALNTQGLVSEGDQVKLGRAIADAVAGVQVTAGKSRSATPMSPNLALLQNLRGMLGKAAPAEMAVILEQLYRLGKDVATSEAGTHSNTVSSQWLAAVDLRMEQDPLVRMIDSAAGTLLPGDASRARPSGPEVVVDLRPGSLPNTPFTWFATSWERLTSEEWVAALPVRVWVDWANTVLRLAVGLGFMWEALWFEGIAPPS